MFQAIQNYFLTNNHHASLLGIVVFLFIAFLFSNNRQKVCGRKVGGALAIQFLLAFFILKTSLGGLIFGYFATGFNHLYGFANSGIEFVFGNLSNANESWGFIFVVKVIPITIFFSALMSLLFHFGVIQFIVKIISIVIRPILKTSGAETLCATGNSMLGPTEAPLLIKKYLNDMTESEMLVVMISGMSTISAGMIAVYGSIGVPMIHLIAASIMSIPGALLISKILVPETGEPKTASSKSVSLKKDTHNMFDAIAAGTVDGVKMAGIIIGMLLVFVSLMAIINSFLMLVTGGNYGLNDIFAFLFSKVAWLIGISAEDSEVAGSLIGQKLVINELVAYLNFVKETMTERSRDILTYALCGFANFSVIGILIGGVGVLAPNHRKTLAKFGLRALLGGTLVNLLNAAIAGLLI